VSDGHQTDFQRQGETNVNATMLEGYLPEFSGLLSEGWEPALYGPAERAAKDYASSQDRDRKLDRVDFLDAFAEAGNFPRQCATLARSYCDIFAIHLAIMLGIPHGVRFERYDEGSDRIVVTVPLPAVLFILNQCEEKRQQSEALSVRASDAALHA
jgi:hypothetical protein